MPRGRNKDLIDKRNEALCRRWYYWTEVQRLRFDDALKILSEQEFFISEDRVMAIIRQYCKEHPEGDIRPGSEDQGSEAHGRTAPPVLRGIITRSPARDTRTSPRRP